MRGSVSRWLAVVVAGALLAGCSGGGDGGGGGDVAEERLTHAQLLEQADAICTEEQDVATQIVAPAGALSESTASEYLDYFDQISTVLDRMLERLDALAPPEEDEAAWDDYIAALEAAIGAFGDLQQATADGDFDAVSAAETEINELNARATQLSEELGLQVCGG